MENVPKEQIEAFERTDSNGHRTGIEQTYGCTLMCFASTRTYWFAFHIGNGKCVAISVDSGRIENSEPVPWDEKCLRNVTTSLCDPEALEKFRYCYGGKDTLPLAVFLGSDGIDDSLPDPADMATGWLAGQAARDFTPTERSSFSGINLEESPEFRTTKYFCKTNFNMGKIKQEEAAYVDLPKIYAFKDDRQKEIMLNRNFARVNREIDEMIKSLLNSV